MNAQRLTDFVLNELDDNARREVEAAIKSDPAVRAEVEEIRNTVTKIEAAMRDEVVAQTATKTRRWYRISVVEWLVAAAGVAVLLAILLPQEQTIQVSQQSRHSREGGNPQDKETQLINESIAVKSVPVDIPASAPETVEQRVFNRLPVSPAEMLSPAPASPPPPQLGINSDSISIGGTWSSSGATGGRGGSGATSRRSSGEMVSSGQQMQVAIPASSSLRGTFAYDSGAPTELFERGRARADVSESKEERIPRDPYNSANDEAYQKFAENEFLKPSAAPFSTFSIDVDTAAYSTMRRFVKEGGKVPKDAVRLEEYINYFKYSYPQPKGDAPFAVVADVVRCPWESQHLLARVALQGKIIADDDRPATNLVFLIDVSGSMSASNRLPLVKRSLTELVERLQSRDRVAIVTYAGSTQVVLPSVSGNEKRAILDSIESLTSGGSTAGASGIKLAYETARKYYTKDGQNRVILCTDGDFNVGTTDNKTLEEMIGDEAKSGVFLTVLGFGMGNYKDERLSVLSQRGNGNYGYIDSLDEAQKLLVEGLTGTLVTIAKDVKIQIDFNPKRVAAYRLLGYENRKLRDEDFHNDAKDAGEIGAGHSVTALYEIVPLGVRVPQGVDTSRYAEKPTTTPEETTSTDVNTAHSDELLLVKLRYKDPEESKSKLIETPLIFVAGEEKEAAGDFAFSAGVALFGMLLRDSQYVGSGNFGAVRELVAPNTGDDKYRQEFLELVKSVTGQK